MAKLSQSIVLRAHKSWQWTVAKLAADERVAANRYTIAKDEGGRETEADLVE